ncbi:MAG: hypothetical protein RLZZ611_1620 [Cyanobacteriota bacterium]|jgi:hypothetical protein
MIALIRHCLVAAAAGLLPMLQVPVCAQLLTNGYTFSRQQGFSTSSSAKSVVLGGSRVLGSSCRDQVQAWYKQQNIANWLDQGCITEPENVIALPLVPGQLEQFQIIDKTRKFGVADRIVSTSSEADTHQKSVSGFTGFGYSVFVQPQY